MTGQRTSTPRTLENPRCEPPVQIQMDGMSLTSLVRILLEGFRVKYLRLRPGSPHWTLSGIRLDRRDDTDDLFLSCPIVLHSFYLARIHKKSIGESAS